MEERRIICRGDIYWTKVKPHKPVIVVSGNEINDNTDFVLVAPMTTNPAYDLDTHCTIRVGRESVVLAERIKPMKMEDIGNFIDTCNTSEMMQLDFCLISAFGLDYLLKRENEDMSEKDSDDVCQEPEDEEPERCILRDAIVDEQPDHEDKDGETEKDITDWDIISGFERITELELELNKARAREELWEKMYSQLLATFMP